MQHMQEESCAALFTTMRSRNDAGAVSASEIHNQVRFAPLRAHPFAPKHIRAPAGKHTHQIVLQACEEFQPDVVLAYSWGGAAAVLAVER